MRKLLRDIVKRVAPEKAYLELQPQLQRVVAHVLEECSTMADFGTVFAMEPFMKLLTFFDAETQTQNCKMVLDAFSKAQGTTADPVLVSSLMQVATQRHDACHVTPHLTPRISRRRWQSSCTTRSTPSPSTTSAASSRG